MHFDEPDPDWGTSARRWGGALVFDLFNPPWELIRLRLVCGGPLRPAGCAAGAGRLRRCRLGSGRPRAGLAPGEELIEGETAGLRPSTRSLRGSSRRLGGSCGLQRLRTRTPCDLLAENGIERDVVVRRM